MLKISWTNRSYQLGDEDDWWDVEIHTLAFKPIIN